jgi:hypothetical protein
MIVTGKETILELRGTLTKLLERRIERIMILFLPMILHDSTTLLYYGVGGGLRSLLQ